MTTIIRLSLLGIAFLLGGCVWPGMDYPGVEVRVEPSSPGIAAPGKFRAVIVQYELAGGNGDNRVKILKVFTTRTPVFAVQFLPQLYWNVATIESQKRLSHYHAGVAVYVEGCWPLCVEIVDSSPDRVLFDPTPLNQSFPTDDNCSDFPFTGKDPQEIDASLQRYRLSESERQIVLKAVKRYREFKKE